MDYEIARPQARDKNSLLVQTVLDEQHRSKLSSGPMRMKRVQISVFQKDPGGSGGKNPSALPYLPG